MTDWAEETPTIELVKSTVTVTDVLDMLGIEVDSQDKFTSPWRPDERTPSAQAYDDHFWDYGAGKGGDVIDLVRAYCPDLGLSKILWRLWSKALKAGLEPGQVERQPVRQLVDFSEQLADLETGYLAHLHSPLGYFDARGNFLIPHRDAEGVYGVKIRGVDGSKSAWPGSQPTKRLYCMHGWARPRSEHVYITEGESDAWCLQAQLPDAWVLALPSGAGAFKRHWLDDLPAKVTLIFDNDKAGKDARDKWDRETKWSVDHLFVPALANDVREAVSRWNWRP